MNVFEFSHDSNFVVEPLADGGNVFTFQRAPIAVYYPTPAPPIAEPTVFKLGCYDNNQSEYSFFDTEAYRLYRDDYVPSSTFTVPMPCYYGYVDPPTPPHTATGLVQLDNATGHGVGYIIEAVNRTLVREPVCVPSDNGDQINKAMCATSEVSTALLLDFCAPQQDGVALRPLLDVRTENTIVITLDSCITAQVANPVAVKSLALLQDATPVPVATKVKVEPAIFMSQRRCSLRQQGEVTLGDNHCVVSQDMSAVEFLESKTVHPISGEPYTPLHTFSIEPYTEVSTTHDRLCPHVFDNYQLTFKMAKVVTADLSTFKLLNYATDTFFTPLLFYPVNTICAKTEFEARRWQWIFGQSLNVTLNHGRAPLRLSRCTDSSDAVIERSRHCSVQEDAMQPPNGFTPWVDPPIIIDPEPPGGETETIVVPIQEVYTMLNTITVTLADGTTPVNIADVGLDFDVDTHSWTWSGALLSVDQVDVLKPTANGVPVIIHVTINGVLWHLAVERVVVSRTFNNKGIQLSGRGVSALLDVPYQDATSVEVTTLLSNQQIAESFLPNGWTLVWQLPTWNIPANTYSHQDLTPATALLRFVKQCGGMLVPSRDSQTITVRKRYPVLPWLFASGTPDVIIPDSIIVGLTEEPTAEHGANGVYVHGLEGGGKQALCRITGTSGARLATTASNNLMVGSTSIRSLGERVLAGEYVQPKIRSINTVMDGGATIPLIEAGAFVEFVVDGIQDRGIVNSISIGTSFSEREGIKVSQSMTIGESTSNVYSLFRELIPTDAVLLVTLNSTDTTTSIVQLVNGDTMRVRGTGTVGQKYYLKGGAIEGSAPSLPILSEIVV